MVDAQFAFCCSDDEAKENKKKGKSHADSESKSESSEPEPKRRDEKPIDAQQVSIARW